MTISLHLFLEKRAILLIFAYKDESGADPMHPIYFAQLTLFLSFCSSDKAIKQGVSATG